MTPEPNQLKEFARWLIEYAQAIPEYETDIAPCAAWALVGKTVATIEIMKQVDKILSHADHHIQRDSG